MNPLLFLFAFQSYVRWWLTEELQHGGKGGAGLVGGWVADPCVFLSLATALFQASCHQTIFPTNQSNLGGKQILLTKKQPSSLLLPLLYSTLNYDANTAACVCCEYDYLLFLII